MNAATSAESRVPGQDVVIDVHHLTKKFGGRAVVHDLSMQVKRGQIYGFLGPNGSGKTTTIRMLCGLLTPDEGTGTCLGYDIRTETDKIKLQVGYMTQRFSLYQDLSVRENLEFVARLYGVYRESDGTSERALFVIDEAQGQGHGTALLDAAMAQLRQVGHRQAFLFTGKGTKAEGFYRAKGWQSMGANMIDEMVFRLWL